MSSILYCGACTMPPEYCRYSGKYSQCLVWMKENEAELFETEIKDIQKRDPKTAAKCQYLWDPNAAPPKPSKAPKAKKPANAPENDNNDNDDNINDNDDDEEEEKTIQKQGKAKKKAKAKNTKKVTVLETRVTIEENLAEDQMADIESKLRQLSTTPADGSSPTIGILKNKKNPNFRQEQQNLEKNSQTNTDDDDDSDDEDEDGDGGGDKCADREKRGWRQGQNMNRQGGPPPRKLTKQRPRRKERPDKKNQRGKGRNQEDGDEIELKGDGQNECDEEEETEEQRQKRVRFEAMSANRKLPKGIVQVELENRKGKKKVTVVRGFIEKSKDKDQRIKSEFMKKFATSVTITFQNIGAESGPKQVVLMGDKRYDFMQYLQQRFPKASKLLYYKTRKYGLTPAVDPDHGFIMPPP